VEFIYGAMLVIGGGYLVLMIVGGLGQVSDFGLDGIFHDLHLDALFGLNSEAGAEFTGVGCSVLSAFLAGFGAVGLTGTRLGWNPLVGIIVALALGYLLAFGVTRTLAFVMASQSTERFSSRDLIGLSARVTINTAPGQTTEVMIEEGQTLRYAAREVNNAELKRGDIVRVVDVDGNQLRVQK